jgi:hypothetical protein
VLDIPFTSPDSEAGMGLGYQSSIRLRNCGTSTKSQGNVPADLIGLTGGMGAEMLTACATPGLRDLHAKPQ